MSQAHDSIALAGISVQSREIRERFKPYQNELFESSWYPDKVKEVKKTKDARFLWPPPPRTRWQKRLIDISGKNKFWTWCGNPPLDYLYLCGHHIRQVVACIKAGDMESAVKFCGVYSHLIADIIEPGHAVFDWMLDILAPSSAGGNERDPIFTNKECLRGPADIKGYNPKLIGDNVKTAEMAAIAQLIKGCKAGAALAMPMEQAIYAGDEKQARCLSSEAQSESAMVFADFVHTVFHLAGNTKESLSPEIDLCDYPYVFSVVSCQCRFRPLVDVFIDPSSFCGIHESRFVLKKLPLAIIDRDGNGLSNIHGLCIMPDNIGARSSVEYFIVPGAYDIFSARVGFNPLFRDKSIAGVFRVLGDGKELSSVVVMPGEAAVEINAILGNTRFLTLEMGYAGSFSEAEREKFKSYNSGIHGVWAGPVLKRRAS